VHAGPPAPSEPPPSRPISRNPESRPLRRQRYRLAVLREFSFGPGHSWSRASSREKFFADIVEFPLALPQLIEQRGRPMSFRDGSRQILDLRLQFLPLVSHESLGVAWYRPGARAPGANILDEG
jgi:hypothetical protein